MKVKTFFIALVIVSSAMVTAACGYTEESQAKQNDIEVADSIISNYCREIDSLCYSKGFEIDADSIDLLNPNEMEEEAYRLIGPYFYVWRSNESKYSSKFDDIISTYYN